VFRFSGASVFSVSAVVPFFEDKLQSLLRLILASDNFNSRKLKAAGIAHPRASLQELPFTTKTELLADRLAFPPFGSALTEPLVNYTRFCQTSGTSTGQPMAWVDTRRAGRRCWSAGACFSVRRA